MQTRAQKQTHTVRSQPPQQLPLPSWMRRVAALHRQLEPGSTGFTPTAPSSSDSAEAVAGPTGRTAAAANSYVAAVGSAGAAAVAAPTAGQRAQYDTEGYVVVDGLVPVLLATAARRVFYSAGRLRPHGSASLPATCAECGRRLSGHLSLSTEWAPISID